MVLTILVCLFRIGRRSRATFEKAGFERRKSARLNGIRLATLGSVVVTPTPVSTEKTFYCTGAAPVFVRIRA